MTHMHPRRLVLASDNAGKLAELQALLEPLQIEVLPQRLLGVVGAVEPHSTFLENALAKARHAAQASGLPALADDSGLCCVALNGSPGVRSARFAGDGAGDAQNNAQLVARLAGIEERRAHYVCLLVAMRSPQDPEPIVAEGRWFGRIVTEPRGTNGFGYDPSSRAAPTVSATTRTSGSTSWAPPRRSLRRNRRTRSATALRRCGT